MGKNGRPDNGGFSLVELIVVVLITAILSGGVATSVVILHDADVTAASKKLVSMLTTARSYTVSKSGGTVWFEIAKEDGGGFYAYIYHGDKSAPDDADILSKEKLGGKSLTLDVTKEKDDGTQEITRLEDGQTVQFNFIKSSGALLEKYTDITFSGGNDKSENIIVINETGRCIRDI
ncbi:MAG: prepilin-type N-terminal cleavage/methylation domain-containing protein [Lachnospiraceae bacterium]|nr:prepilin-type N-terminal cleavage/methylation domain-containing protein [Lachnospiraceae bacterium]